jgi:hypothetical protein
VHSHQSYTPRYQHPPRDLNITVIRRDPNSGAQWNIGSITIVDVPSPDGSGVRVPKIGVHISTPGYISFSDVPRLGFQREVLAFTGDGFWDKTLRRHRRGSSSEHKSNFRPGHSRTKSDMSSFSDLSIGSPTSPIKKPEKVRGYNLQSPWGGRCEFTTSTSTRTLKCRHTLPPPTAALRNPDGSADLEGESAPVSELRYNMPSVDIFTRSKPAGTTPTAVQEKRRSKLQLKNLGNLSNIRTNFTQRRRSQSDPFADAHELAPPLPPRPPPTSFAAMYPDDSPRHSHFAEADEDGEEDRLDLSLGQEKAGGGNRGKRAKMGKLIIHDEGIKMLDLVVCGNMGIWWEGWEK